MSAIVHELADALKTGSWDEADEIAAELRNAVEDDNDLPEMNRDAWIDLLDGIEKVLQDV